MIMPLVIDRPITSSTRLPRHERLEDAYDHTLGYDEVPSTVLLANLLPPHELIKSLPLSIEVVGSGYTAHFEAANVNASGDSLTEAVTNLASLLTDLFDELSTQPADVLSQELQRNLAAMQSYVRRSSDAR